MRGVLQSEKDLRRAESSIKSNTSAEKLKAKLRKEKILQPRVSSAKKCRVLLEIRSPRQAALRVWLAMGFRQALRFPSLRAAGSWWMFLMSSQVELNRRRKKPHRSCVFFHVSSSKSFLLANIILQSLRVARRASESELSQAREQPEKSGIE